ncbi:MAG: hypothetical protein IJ480_09125 [Clostridia bacterium]|nr:hypothetical protein [Clostridia bacterium]
MKTKLLALCLAAVMSLGILTSCGTEEAVETETAPAAETEAETETETETETEPEIEAPKKRDKHQYIDMYVQEGDRSPVSLMNAGSSVAARITFAEGFLEEASIACPSWNDNVGSLTMKIFKWDTDYNTTVAAEPVFSQTYADYSDNEILYAEFFTEESRGLEAGEYLWWLGDGVDSSGSGVGLWTYKHPTDMEGLVELYQDGAVTTAYGWEGSLTIVIPAE